MDLVTHRVATLATIRPDHEDRYIIIRQILRTPLTDLAKQRFNQRIRFDVTEEATGLVQFHTLARLH